MICSQTRQKATVVGDITKAYLDCPQFVFGHPRTWWLGSLCMDLVEAAKPLC